MTSFNRVFLLGRLTREPLLRYTPKGTPVVEINLALNRVLKAEDGAKHEEVTFVPVTSWDRLGEIALKYLKKGSPVLIEGRLHLDTWEDKQSAQKHSRLRVIGQNPQLLGRHSVAASGSPASASKLEENQITPAPSLARPARVPIPDPDLDIEPL